MLPCVAFVRFVTLGRGGQSNDLLRRAYREAGATESATFLATGNVVFETRSEPVAVAARARSLLRDWIGFRGYFHFAQQGLEI